MNRAIIPYNQDQINAHIDSCIYGLSYGVEASSTKYIADYLKIDENQISSIGLDDLNQCFVVTISYWR